MLVPLLWRIWPLPEPVVQFLPPEMRDFEQPPPGQTPFLSGLENFFFYPWFCRMFPMSALRFRIVSQLFDLIPAHLYQLRPPALRPHRPAA